MTVSGWKRILAPSPPGCSPSGMATTASSSGSDTLKGPKVLQTPVDSFLFENRQKADQEQESGRLLLLYGGKWCQPSDIMIFLP